MQQLLIITNYPSSQTIKIPISFPFGESPRRGREVGEEVRRRGQ
jgi:hypothetical protein